MIHVTHHVVKEPEWEAHNIVVQEARRLLDIAEEQITLRLVAYEGTVRQRLLSVKIYEIVVITFVGRHVVFQCPSEPHPLQYKNYNHQPEEFTSGYEALYFCAPEAMTCNSGLVHACDSVACLYLEK
jgi:hypothetical protein